MKINIKSFGYDKIQKAIKKANKDLTKAYSDLIKIIAKTAVAKARELAPRANHTGQHYYQSIKNQVLTKFTQWVYAERKGKPGSEMKGYLGNVLEYGRKTYKPMAPRPHMQAAVEYAMQVHEKDITAYFEGKFVANLKEFI